MHSSHNELLHPLWLGLLILFTVIVLLGLLCCLRRRCTQTPSPSPEPVVRSSSSNVFLPPIRRSPSPKLYQLIKTMKTAATQKEHQPGAAEVARKFYASMRYASPSTETIDVSPMPDKSESNLRLFRTPRFFQSIADSGLSLSFSLHVPSNVNVVLDECTLNI